MLNQAASWKRLLELVRGGIFELAKPVFCELNGIVAFEEALEWGKFRSGPVSIAGTQHRPPRPEELDGVFENGLAFLLSLANPIERGMAFFLFGALQQFFHDGNRRTARLVMNGELLRHGLDAISIPAARKQEFNEKMIRFYDSREGTDMMRFLSSCSPAHC